MTTPGMHKTKITGNSANLLDLSQYSEEFRNQILEGWKVARALLDAAVLSEPDVTKTMQMVAEATGGKLEGLKYKLKSENSLKEKVIRTLAEKSMILPTALSKELRDILRYTVCYQFEKYSESVITALQQLKKCGYEIVRVKNFWDSQFYKGINSVIMTDGRQNFEVQFHTPESLQVKETKLHPLYEEVRALEALLIVVSDEEQVQEGRKLLKGIQKKMADEVKDVPVPKDVMSIGSLA